MKQRITAAELKAMTMKELAEWIEFNACAINRTMVMSWGHEKLFKGYHIRPEYIGWKAGRLIVKTFHFTSRTRKADAQSFAEWLHWAIFGEYPAEETEQPTETENAPQAATQAAEGTDEKKEDITMKTTLKFGKIAATNNRKENAVEIEIELRQSGGEPTFTIEAGKRIPTGNTTPAYIELSICGTVWNRLHTDCIMGGQCLDEIAPHLKHNPVFMKVYEYWKRYHLNGMHAGTPEQEAAIEEWKAAGNRYDYKAACEELKRRGLYTVNYTGLSIGKRYDNEPYTYGHAWLIQEIPGDVLLWIEHLIDTSNSATA